MIIDDGNPAVLTDRWHSDETINSFERSETNLIIFFKLEKITF